MHGILSLMMLEEMEENERISRPVRDRSDPFQMISKKFIRRFRVNKELAKFLIDNLKDELPNEEIAPSTRVLVALRFFATGSNETCFANVSPETVSTSVKTVSNAINKVLMRQIVQFPDLNEQQIIKQRFFERFGLPGTLGAIDCTQIQITEPAEESHAFWNRYGFYSLNLQLVADDMLKIRGMNARFPGSCDDAHIWRFCNLRSHLETMYNQQETNTWLLGDNNYPLEPWLLIPFVDPKPATMEESFNIKHASAHYCVKQCVRILKARFKCLARPRILEYTPIESFYIIYACIVLHNLCIDYGIGLDDIQAIPHSVPFASDDANLTSAAEKIRNEVAAQL